METSFFPSHPQWVTERIVAEITGLSVHTLRKSRFLRRGIPYSKIGRAVRYDLADVDAYMRENRVSWY